MIEKQEEEQECLARLLELEEELRIGNKGKNTQVR